MFLQRVKLITAALIALTSGVEGREDTQEGGLLERTVVTATRSPSDLLDSPVTLSVLGREQIERRPAASIAELFRHNPGVMVTDNAVPGFQRFRIRGEDARRSLIMVDGQPISDHSSMGAPMLIAPSFIERVELVRGPHSTLYGSQAAGGVVNFITKHEPVDGFEGSAGASYDSANSGYRGDLSAIVGDGAWYFKAATAHSRSFDRRTPGGRLDGTESEWTGHMLQAGWADEVHSFRVSYEKHDLSSEAHTRPGTVDGFVISRFRLDLPQRSREKFGVFYEGKDLLANMERLRVDAYYQTVDRNLTLDIAGLVLPPAFPPRFYSYFNDDFDTIDTLGLNVQTDWRLNPCHTLIAGANYVRDDMDKSITRTGFTRFGPVITPVNRTINTRADLETFALYLQETWKPNEHWQVVAGIRAYSVKSSLKSTNDPAVTVGSDKDTHTIGSLSVLYKPNENLALRASWAQGYVYPTLLHLHTGSLFGQGNFTHPNPGLEPETSDNFELGARYRGDGFSADLAVFHNRADNYIATVPSAVFPGDNTYANLNSATTNGVELELTRDLAAAGAELYLQGTWLRREVEFSTFTTSESGVPRLSGRVGARYDSTTSGGVRWYMDAYIAASDSSAERTSRSTTKADSWVTLNLAAGAYISDTWVGIEALNLTNTSYRPSVDELTQPGLHCTFGVRHAF